MVVIVAGGILLSWSQDAELGIPWGALAIAGACICWAIDNNLTRVVSSGCPQSFATFAKWNFAAVAAIPNVDISSATFSATRDGF